MCGFWKTIMENMLIPESILEMMVCEYQLAKSVSNFGARMHWSMQMFWKLQQWNKSERYRKRNRWWKWWQWRTEWSVRCRFRRKFIELISSYPSHSLFTDFVILISKNGEGCKDWINKELERHSVCRYW